MRKIKFRAWKGEKFGMGEPFGLSANPKDGMLSVYINPGDILMQYTGLKDKNGKEIYEGDIVVDKFGHSRQVCWEVNMDGDDRAEFFHAGFEFGGTYPTELEIIGNIYENPELLGESSRPK